MSFPKKKKLSFQQIIMTLQQFWIDEGCTMLQPYDMEMGAGTFHPATVMRSLGSKPWNVVFVQPSRRPVDSRYGQNPNRAGVHNQLQVILKSPPDNIQEKYLESLSRLGINTKYDDIRFVEDDWESPSLGASGLGWEVWYNGMEVTQFTYMQQLAGIECRPVVGEITYGLERLALHIQGKDSIWDLDWNGAGMTYKDVAFDPEVQFSGFNLEYADVSVMRRQFEEAEKQCLALAEVNLPFPSYDFCIKASHLFNLMSARGVISVVERASYIARLRALAKASALKWLEMQDCKPSSFTPNITSAVATPLIENKSDLLLELYMEEIPAMMQKPAEISYINIFTKHLNNAHVKYDELKVYVGPRRITLYVKAIEPIVEGKTLEVKGPKVVAAEQAIEGFCKSNNITRDQLTIKLVKDQECYFSESETAQQNAADLLREILPRAVDEYTWPKSMYWNNHATAWIRPLKNILCLLGSHVLPLTYGHLAANNKTWGHRFMAYHEIEILSFEQYKEALKDNFVILNREERRELIKKEVENFSINAPLNNTLLEEVTGLVEYPVVLKGAIPERFMNVPGEVLVAAMEKHQRYFAMYNKDGSFAPNFLFVSNIKTDDPANIIEGNERVLNARLSDAAFFYENGKKEFEEAELKLVEVMFHSKLGSMQDKVKRIEELCKFLAPSNNELHKAALLCKNDLATEIVDEFPELQGVIGGYYANSRAIRDHYKPMGQDDSVPIGDAALLALADKIDSLVSLMMAGERATGSGDPYALRRYALGIIRILIENNLKYDLKKLTSNNVEVLKFIEERLKHYLRAQGYDHKLINAAIGFEQEADIATSVANLKELDSFLKTKEGNDLLTGYRRASGILRDKKIISEAHFLKFKEKIEHELFDAIMALPDRKGDKLIKEKLNDLYGITGLINEFFNNVMVNAEDALIANNRLALLHEVVKKFDKIAKFRELA